MGIQIKQHEHVKRIITSVFPHRETTKIQNTDLYDSANKLDTNSSHILNDLYQ